MELTEKELKQILPKVFEKCKKEYSVSTFDDCFSVCVMAEKYDSDEAHRCNRIMRNHISKALKRDNADLEALYGLYKKSLLFDAPVSFDAYMLYLEIDRPVDKQFYLPRRKQLKPVVEAIQDLMDDKLDELFLSMPPRVGKTTIILMAVTWIIGRTPERSNLYSAYSDTITKAFYNGILEIIEDNVTYKWKEIFPDYEKIVKSSEYETVNIGRPKRYPSITCRGIDGTLNGACDCDNLLIGDDLVGGYEQAINRDTLVKLWGKVNNNLIPRAKEQAKKLWMGTRWSILDPTGQRLNMIETDKTFASVRYRIITLPALDENGESNFNYLYGVGFTSEYYRQRRASFERTDDMASWLAQFQQQPIEREGTLFPSENFRYFNGELPDCEPDRIFMAVDPAFGGGDYVAAPVCFMYGDDIFVKDVVYSNADKSITQPLLVNAINKYDVQAMQIEANKTTESYKEGIDDMLKAKGIRINLTSKPAPSNIGKENRIKDKAPEIKEFMIFIESGKRSKDYEAFMQNVYSFKLLGKNKHDDAPDSLAMAMNMIRYTTQKVQAVKRPF